MVGTHSIKAMQPPDNIHTIDPPEVVPNPTVMDSAPSSSSAPQNSCPHYAWDTGSHTCSLHMPQLHLQNGGECEVICLLSHPPPVFARGVRTQLNHPGTSNLQSSSSTRGSDLPILTDPLHSTCIQNDCLMGRAGRAFTRRAFTPPLHPLC